MLSEDTMHYALREEEDAKILQHEIDKEQAEIDGLQKDINTKSQVISSLRTKLEQHLRNARKLREQAQVQHQQEEQQLRSRAQNKESLLKKGAKEAAWHGLLG